MMQQMSAKLNLRIAVVEKIQENTVQLKYLMILKKILGDISRPSPAAINGVDCASKFLPCTCAIVG